MGISDAHDWKESKKIGRQVKIDQNTLMWKAEKEIADKVDRDKLAPEAAKLALAAKETSIYAAGPVSAAVESASEAQSPRPQTLWDAQRHVQKIVLLYWLLQVRQQLNFSKNDEI